MIANNKPGMRHDVSLEDHRRVLLERRVRAMHSNAQRVARRIAKLVKSEFGPDMRDDMTLSGLARQYGVVKQLIPFTVACVRKELMGV